MFFVACKTEAEIAAAGAVPLPDEHEDNMVTCMG